MKRRIISLILGIPRTLWFNFRYLPFYQAIRIPVLLASNVRIRDAYYGGVKLAENKQFKFGQIRIGFHEVEPLDIYSLHTILSMSNKGHIIFKGNGHIGRGAIIHCDGGNLIFGDNIAISGTTSIICKNKVTIGDDVQFSYHGIVMDSDAHKIYDADGKIKINHDQIIIGNKVWIAPNVTILKGSVLNDNTIVASNSLINQKFSETGVIIGGIPGKVLKKISHWEI